MNKNDYESGSPPATPEAPLGIEELMHHSEDAEAAAKEAAASVQTDPKPRGAGYKAAAAARDNL